MLSLLTFFMSVCISVTGVKTTFNNSLFCLDLFPLTWLCSVALMLQECDRAALYVQANREETHGLALSADHRQLSAHPYCWI